MKEYVNSTKENDVLSTEEWEQQKGFHPFYLFPVMYVASLYLLPFFVSLGQKVGGLSYLVYLPIVFGILNIIVSIVFCKPENRIMMLNATVLVKYTMIPFFIIGGFMVLVCFLFSFIPVPFMIFLGPTMAILGLITGWFILVFEAPYVISYLHLSSKVKFRPTIMTVLHIVLQFFFGIDVIDVMFLTLTERRWKKLTIGIIIFLIICIAIILIWIIKNIIGISMT